MAQARRSATNNRGQPEIFAYAREYERNNKSWLRLLDKDRIILLKTKKQKSKSYPKAKFFCEVCNFYMEDDTPVDEHRATAAHQIKVKKDELKRLAEPTVNHVAVTSYLKTTYRNYHLGKEAIAARNKVVEELDKLIHQHSRLLKDVSLELSGSVRGGFALNTSDTNIRIVAPEDSDRVVIFSELYRVLTQSDPVYEEVVMKVETRYPSISFMVRNVSRFTLQFVEDGIHRTQLILSFYSHLHPKLKQLMTLIKYWAEIADLSNVSHGGLLPLSFPILVIYWCQNVDLAPIFLVDDIELIPQEELESQIQEQVRLLQVDFPKNKSLGFVWLDMLRFYCLDFDVGKTCVSIMAENIITKEEKTKWKSSKHLSIEEPGAKDWNLCHGLTTQVLNFTIQQIQECYQYFGLSPRSPNGYDFQEMKVELPIYCRVCHKPGHFADDCPDEMNLPPCRELHPLSDEHRDNLNHALTVDVTGYEQWNSIDGQIREYVLREIGGVLRETFPDMHLKLCGSSINGFGSFRSDVDISVTFDEEMHDYDEVLEQIEQTLEMSERFGDVQLISEAKVPIVKCSCERYKVHCDLALFNCLAVENSKMLFRYSQIDERVRILGFTVKEFAKKYEICDTFQGTLSSYAYILMLIYYLQRCDPPVLPVLQELYDGDDKPEHMIDGKNAWFYDEDNASLKQRWPQLNANKQDVAELWIGFLKFYAYEFRFKTTVVSIRQLAIITQSDKFWHTERLAIEDPFDIHHNLGITPNNKNAHMLIMHRFAAAREVFATSVSELPDYYESWWNYFFDNEDIEAAKKKLPFKSPRK